MMMGQGIRRLAAGALAAGLVFAASAAVGADDKVIKIGALLPMSGPGSYFGVQDKQGIELALEQINRIGIGGSALKFWPCSAAATGAGAGAGAGCAPSGAGIVPNTSAALVR
jgi:hypothetical protein